MWIHCCNNAFRKRAMKGNTMPALLLFSFFTIYLTRILLYRPFNFSLFMKRRYRLNLLHLWIQVARHTTWTSCSTSIARLLSIQTKHLPQLLLKTKCEEFQGFHDVAYRMLADSFYPYLHRCDSKHAIIDVFVQPQSVSWARPHKHAHITAAAFAAAFLRWLKLANRVRDVPTERLNNQLHFIRARSRGFTCGLELDYVNEDCVKRCGRPRMNY